ALHVGGKLGKLNVLTDGQTEKGFDWNDRYNIWSGLIGGFFLALSYFGTDQSQVGRYLTAQNNTESRLGLLMNGLVKIPMQFFILLIGVLIFAFYQFNPAPLSFNESVVQEVQASRLSDSARVLQQRQDSLGVLKKEAALRFATAVQTDNEDSINALSATLKELNTEAESNRATFKKMSASVSSRDANDTNYVFLSFAKKYLPAGLKGLLIAIIFLAAWGSIAAALNSLASSTVVDFHMRYSQKKTEEQEYRISRWYTLAWGVFCILVAEFSYSLGQSLIEAVNVLGSLFYGVILGIFLVAFYIRHIKGPAIFWSALGVECFIIALFFNEHWAAISFLPDVSFLWLNAIGALGVVLVALVLQALIGRNEGERTV
ncbi:MAG TPA: sodium:solute symporter, partial [Chitinophagaceae bacterium]|nr:sodium:solute symporter [Chitinophagaceae bacterium]